MLRNRTYFRFCNRCTLDCVSSQFQFSQLFNIKNLCQEQLLVTGRYYHKLEEKMKTIFCYSVFLIVCQPLLQAERCSYNEIAEWFSEMFYFTNVKKLHLCKVKCSAGWIGLNSSLCSKTTGTIYKFPKILHLFCACEMLPGYGLLGSDSKLS